MKKLIAMLICSTVMTACATQGTGRGPTPGSGLRSALSGIAHLILSPIQIAAGFAEGVSSLPYYMSTNIHDINQGLVDAQASITLDDTYDSAYGRRLSEAGENGETGEVFRRMKHATKSFQAVLKRYGVYEAERYILTSIDTANSDGYTLFAVVYRPSDSIRVVDKYDGRKTRHFTKEDRLFYEPFRQDITGQPLDSIVDWAGLPREYVKTQKGQSLLITLAANAVVEKKRRSDYWENETRWIDGDYLKIVEKQLNGVRQKMRI
jgi:hypothetical protein